VARKYAAVQAHGKESNLRDDSQRRYVRRRDTYDGMVKIEAVLHPEEAEMVWAMLDHAAKQLAHEPAVVTERTANVSAEPFGVQGTASGPMTSSMIGRESACGTEVSAEPLDWQGAAPGSMMESQDPVLRSTAARISTLASMRDRVAAYRALAAAEICCTSDEPVSYESEPVPVAGAEAAYVSEVFAEPDDGHRVDGHRVVDVADSGGGVPRPLHRAVDATRRAFNRADALMMIAQSYLRSDRLNRAPVDVMVTVPASELREGGGDPTEVGAMGGSYVSAETARRLSCDAGVIEVVEDDDHGVPLSVGRKRRSIAGSIKRALLQRDTACVFPGCDNRVFLEGHHVRHWADGGETSLGNACLMCSLHHRFVHEYGYQVEMGPDQRPRFRDPRGRLVPAVATRPAVAPGALGWPHILAANEGLAIDAGTHACDWDGKPMPYGTVIGHLAITDDLD
jgi:hypothetical protein